MINSSILRQQCPAGSVPYQIRNGDTLYRIALDYMHTVYGEQLTENGCKIFLNNRITSAFTAHDENSNLRVSFIKLDPEDAIKGSKNYAFTIQVQAENNISKTFTFKGHIRLIQEDGQWMVDGVSPVY
jgi:hypothetical protein